MAIFLQNYSKIMCFLFIVKDIDKFVYFPVYQKPLFRYHTILYVGCLITVEWETCSILDAKIV